MSPVSDEQAPKTYELTADVNVQDSFQGETFDFTFTAGTHTPKNELEEYALAKAVEALEHIEAQATLDREDENRAAALAAVAETPEDQPAPAPRARSSRSKDAPDLTTSDSAGITEPTPPED